MFGKLSTECAAAAGPKAFTVVSPHVGDGVIAPKSRYPATVAATAPTSKPTNPEGCG
jgi:hypothetical protein